jgi:hypothetical protein
VYFRLSIDGAETADWPLSKKFGCDAQSVINLAIKAQELSLTPYGISFHVGSQQRNIGSWDNALQETKAIFDELANQHQIFLKMLNLGGERLPNMCRKPQNLRLTLSKLMLHWSCLKIMVWSRLFWSQDVHWLGMRVFWCLKLY